MLEIADSNLWPSKAPPDVLVDPFNGLPLRIKADSTGIIIYSVGNNGMDDDGEIPSMGTTRMRDVGFKLLSNKWVYDPENAQ